MAPRKQKGTHTRIVCTLGPATGSVGTLTQMIRAGMHVARINFSHGTHEQHHHTLSLLRQASNAASVPVAVIQDLQGPKIRTGEVSTGPIELRPQQMLTITTKNVAGTNRLISTTYKHLPKDVRKGDRILLDDGKIELHVLAAKGHRVECRVINGGVLTAHKGINLPGISVSAPSLTEKDKKDLSFAFHHDIDYVALSFVRRAHDVAELRDFIIEHGPRGRRIPIITKIEKPEAIADIDDILRETDAVMVARGDLGVELAPEDVPLLQKMIVHKCNELGKPVIIATQMLESMMHTPRPTRAEASDVANAVLDGADAVMLSGETSVGDYPVESVSVMERIIRKTEEQHVAQGRLNRDWIPSTHPYDPLTRSACRLADEVKASVIVAMTHSGVTAAHVAKFRPGSRIIGVTDREKIIRRMNLMWGVTGMIVEDLKKDTDEAYRTIKKRLLDEGYVRHGDVVVMVVGLPLFEGKPTNTVTVEQV